MKKKLMTLVIVGAAIMTSMASADVIAPTGAASRAVLAPGVTEATHLINPAREVGDQYKTEAWPDLFMGLGDAEDEWVYVDLGAEYDLGQLRIWNADNTGVDPKRKTKNMSIHVAGAGAALPTSGVIGTDVDTDGLRNYFMDASWTSLKEAELSSRFFPGFQWGLRAPFSVTGEPAMF